MCFFIRIICSYTLGDPITQRLKDRETKRQVIKIHKAEDAITGIYHDQ